MMLPASQLYILKVGVAPTQWLHLQFGFVPVALLRDVKLRIRDAVSEKDPDLRSVRQDAMTETMALRSSEPVEERFSRKIESCSS